MDKELVSLQALQDIDLRIVELENSKEEFPLEVASLEGEIEKATDVVEALNIKLVKAKEEKAVAVGRIENAKSILERSQERINSIKTNKEYDAVHAEIEINKQLVDSGDKKVNVHNKTISQIEEEISENQNELEKIKTEKQPIIDDLKSKIATIDSDIADVAKGREKAIADIRPAYVRDYEHIRTRRKNGKVLSIITSADRLCTGCYQKMQPNIFNKTRKATELVYCQNCGSILIWQGNIQEPTVITEESAESAE